MNFQPLTLVGLGEAVHCGDVYVMCSVSVVVSVVVVQCFVLHVVYVVFCFSVVVVVRFRVQIQCCV